MHPLAVMTPAVRIHLIRVASMPLEVGAAWEGDQIVLGQGTLLQAILRPFHLPPHLPRFREEAVAEDFLVEVDQ